MSTARPVWNPGPGPAPDGLREAFRRAHRRRVRAAATTALPVLLSAVALAALPMAGGTSSLDVTPADRGTAPVPAPAERALTVARGGSDPTTSTRGGGTGAGAPSRGRDDRANDVPPSPLPSVLPSAGPSSPPTSYLDFSATGTKRTHVVLPDDVTVDSYEAAFTTSSKYAGLYLVSDDGATRGGVFRVPVPEQLTSSASRPPAEVVGSFDRFPAGGYTVYVVGDGAVRVRVPVGPGQIGVTATASTPATAYFDDATRAFGATDTQADVRLPVTGDATSVGLAGSWVYGNGKTQSHIDVCLAARAAQCGPDDPQDDAGSTLSAGAEGATFPLAEGAIDTERDVVAHAYVTAATGRLWAWFVVLDL